MPKVHNIGAQRFFQVIDFPVKWGAKVCVKGWTQEIEEPFRTAEPLIFRLPFYKAFVIGKWTGSKSEEEALDSALQRREVTYDDFQEEKGWRPATDQGREESLPDSDIGLADLGRIFDVRDWATLERVEQDQR